jgi:tungstate transport system substrate-binding protein
MWFRRIHIVAIYTYFSMRRRRYLQLLGAGASLSVAGCAERRGATADSEPSQATLTLATATTAHDSGLLDELLPGFEATFQTTVKPLVRGTGASLRTARDGDCDVVLVHARLLEDEFLRAGHGINRRRLMINDFMIVGPSDDPAQIAGRSPVEAFRAITDTEVPFLSRGDNSGTHVRERRMWDAASITPTGEWYRETGQGMGDTLITAEQVGAYTLTDRGTFLTVSSDGPLVAHVVGGLDDPPPLLNNEYAVIPVNPARHESAYPLAMAFVGYLTSIGQRTIEAFSVNGERAFRPAGLSPPPNFEQYVPTGWPSEGS